MLTIAGQSFVVTQGEAGCSYLLSPTSQSFDANAGVGSVTITTDDGCSWVATSGESWITLTNGSAGTGSGVVTYAVTANDAPSRTGMLTIAGQSFVVTQAGAACSYVLSPTSESFDASGGAGSVTVTTDDGCSWVADPSRVL